MGLLDSMVEKCPTVFPFNVVDDITFFMSGSAKFVQVGLGNATAYPCECLEELCLVISDSKGKSSRPVRKWPEEWPGGWTVGPFRPWMPLGTSAAISG
eukprot:4740739-Pyramimonas_sp.AAC.1